MRRHTRAILTTLLVCALLAGVATGAVACKPKMVTVRTGEIVLCTEGHVVSDTTEEVEVKASDVADYSVKTRVVTCELHDKAAKLYDLAQKAIADGDLDAAEKALAELVALDPTYRNAQSQLGDIRQGNTPEAPVEPPAPPADEATDPDTEEPAPVAGLAAYVPDKLKGYVAQGIMADPFVITREYLPEDDDAVVMLVVVAEQFLDKEAAAAGLDANVRSWYSDAGEDIQVDGREGYFGVRGSAVVAAFVDDAVLVTVEISAADATDAESLRSQVIAIAEEIAP